MSEWVDETHLMDEIDNLLGNEEVINIPQKDTTQHNEEQPEVNGRKIKQEKLDNSSNVTKLHERTDKATDQIEVCDSVNKKTTHEDNHRTQGVTGSKYNLRVRTVYNLSQGKIPNTKKTKLRIQDT